MFLDPGGSRAMIRIEKAEQIEKLGIESDQLISQSLITPSCGAGSLSPDQALKVLRLTKEVSQGIRQ